jgi:ABC-type nitrate/sulfonate/bicarbonate transport system substrate-binding protein
MGVVLQVEREPEDPRRLAAALAEAMQSVEDHQADATTFAAAANAERNKAIERRMLIERIEEHRKKNSGAPRRRMDPMAEYDLPAMIAERDAFFARADEFRTIADKHLHGAEQAKIKVRALQQKIRQSRSS